MRDHRGTPLSDGGRRRCRRRGEGNIRHAVLPATAAPTPAGCGRTACGQGALQAPADAGDQQPDQKQMQQQRQHQRAADPPPRQPQLKRGRNRGAHARGNYTNGRPGSGGRRCNPRRNCRYFASFGVKPMICTPAPRATSMASTTSW
jgi:hypothetical protein